jgi:hypothetical protein
MTYGDRLTGVNGRQYWNRPNPQVLCRMLVEPVGWQLIVAAGGGHNIDLLALLMIQRIPTSPSS